MVKHTASPGCPKSLIGSHCFSDDTHCSPRSVGTAIVPQLFTEDNCKVNANAKSVKKSLPFKEEFMSRLLHTTLQMSGPTWRALRTDKAGALRLDWRKSAIALTALAKNPTEARLSSEAKLKFLKERSKEIIASELSDLANRFLAELETRSGTTKVV